LAGGL